MTARFGISVIIPTRKRGAKLDACLGSLFADDLDGVREVILAAHDEDPEGRRAAARWARRESLVRVVFTDRASRSAARNAALAAADGDWCYFLDDDVVLPRGTIARLVRAIEAYPEAAAIGGPNRAPAESSLFQRCVDRTLHSRLGAWTMRARYRGTEAESFVDERSLIGCNLAVCASALRADRGFCEALNYGEETHLLGLMARRGYKLLHLPQLWVYHERRGTLPGFCAQAYRSGAGRARQTLLDWRSLSPLFLAPAGLLMAAAAALIWPGLWALAVLAPYAAACGLTGLAAGWAEGSFRAALGTAALVPAGHLSYGLGLIIGTGSYPFFIASASRPFGLRLGEAALRLSAAPALAGLLGLYYRGALAALRRWVRVAKLPVAEIWLYRGGAEQGWVPGGSDIDLIVELPAGDGQNATRRWNRGYAVLRRFFPILGEVRLAGREEIRAYLSDGPPRAASWPGTAVPILGRGPFPSPREADEDGPGAWSRAKRSIDAWTEQLHAYARLSQLYFGPRDEPVRSAYHARKLLTDALRYGAWIRDGVPGPEPPLSRRAFALRFDGAEKPAGLTGRDPLLAALVRVGSELESCGALILDSLPETVPGPEGVAAETHLAEADEREASRFADLCGELTSAIGPSHRCSVHDNLFHFLLGLSRDAFEPEAEGMWDQLRALKRSHSSLAGSLLALPPAAMKLAFWGPFGEDPLSSLSLASVSHGGLCFAGLSGRSGLLRRHRLAAWRAGRELSSPPPAPLARAFARESWAHLCLEWRGLGAAPFRVPELARWSYLYGRVMSLKLLLDRGESLPPFPMEPLARRFAEAFPAEAPWIRSRVLAGTETGPLDAHWDFFSRTLRPLPGERREHANRPRS